MAWARDRARLKLEAARVAPEGAVGRRIGLPQEELEEEMKGEAED